MRSAGATSARSTRRRDVEEERKYDGDLVTVLRTPGLLRDLIEDASAKLKSDERAERKIIHAWEIGVTLNGR